MKPLWYKVSEGVVALAILVSYLLIMLVQRRYITRRYEETGLARLELFSNPVFDSFAGKFWRHLFAGFYTLHLFVIWALPDSWRQRLPSCRDVTDRQQVLRHFSRAEVVFSVLVGSLAFFGVTGAVVLVAVRLLMRLGR